MKRTAVVAVLLLVAAVPAVRAHGEHAAVLFDFGDGRYAWATVEEGNAWNMTQEAALTLGYDLNYTTTSGVFLLAVDGESGDWPDWWWHLFTWNVTQGAWLSSEAGASDLVVEGGGALAWRRTVDDPVTFAGAPPVATPVHPTPWTSFRGDAHGAGVSLGYAPPSPGTVWSRDTGDRLADGTPVTYGGTVAVSTENGLWALDAATGETRWSRADLRGMSTPAVWNGSLLLGAWDGRLHRVDAGTGAEVWNLSLAATPETILSSSVTEHKGVAYVGTFDQSGGGGSLFAIDLFARRVAWELNTSSIHVSSPAVADGLVVVGVTGLFNRSAVRWDPPHGLLAVHLNGDLAWFFPTDGPVASSPAVAGDRIFFATRGSRLYAVNVSGQEDWNRTIGYSVSSPAVAGGRVYVGSGEFNGEGKVRAFTVGGDALWETSVNGPVQSGVVHALGTVYMTTNAPQGSVYALHASNGSVRWQWTAQPEQYILGSPTVSGGRVYVAGDSGSVYALGASVAAAPLPVGPAVYAAIVVTVALVAAGFIWIRRRPKA